MNPVSLPGVLEPGMKLLAQRGVERPVDEVVGLLHADLPARLGEVSFSGRGGRSARSHRWWPRGHLLIQHLGRPPAPRQRASANGEDQPSVVERRMIHPRHAQIGRAAHKRHVLHVLGQHERPGLEHENAAAARGVGDEQMFRDDGAKGAAADDDYIEVALVARRRSGRRCRALPAMCCRGTAPCCPA